MCVVPSCSDNIERFKINFLQGLEINCIVFRLWGYAKNCIEWKSVSSESLSRIMQRRDGITSFEMLQIFSNDLVNIDFKKETGE